MLTEILGWLATVLFTVMLIPQITKTIKEKHVKGVSVWQYVVYFIANIIALLYALLIFQPPLIIKYFVAILITLFYFCVFWRMK